MRRWRFTRPPRGLRRRHVRLDNIARVPASLLPYREHWQRIANELPQGSVLIVTPLTGRLKRATLEEVALQLQARGHRVVTVLTSQAAPNTV